MTKKKALISTLILSIVLTILLVVFSDYILLSISTFVQKLEKFLTFSLNLFDAILIGFIPFWNVILYQNKHEITYKKLIYRTLLSVFSLVIFSLLGFIIIYTYKFTPSMFSPEFLIYQPFPFYWTIFFVIALLLPALLTSLFKSKK